MDFQSGETRCEAVPFLHFGYESVTVPTVNTGLDNNFGDAVRVSSTASPDTKNFIEMSDVKSCGYFVYTLWVAGSTPARGL